MRNFQPTRDAALVPPLHQIESLSLILYRLLHNLILGIEFAKGEVVGSEFRTQHQLHISQVRGRGLQ